MWFLLLLISVLLLILAFLHYAGAFSPVEVTVGPTPFAQDVEVAYKLGKGSFWGVGSYFKEVAGLMPSGVPRFGLYADDPRVVASTDLRWAVGAIISPTPGSPSIDGKLRDLLKDRQYQFGKLPHVDMAVKATMPTRHWVACMFHPWRVYPAIHAYGEKHDAHGHPALEITYPNRAETVYLMPMKKNEQFFLPGIDF